jgi:hypothetical protein
LALTTAVRFVQPRKPRYGLFTMIVEKKIVEKNDARWLIVEAQNTNRIPGPDPELSGIKPPIVFPDEEQP